MTKKCNLNVFFNQFNLKIKRKLYGINSFNGFYDAKSYHRHLEQIIDNFRHDMLYVLPFDKDGDKKVFLRNLFTELSKKKKHLETKYFKEIYTPNKDTCSLYDKSTGVKSLMLKTKKVNCRRITYMYYHQINCLNISMQIIKQTAENFSIELEGEKVEYILLNTGIWDGDPLEFIQLTESLITVGKIITGELSKKQIINNTAKMMGFNLTKYNYDSLSRAIHTNNDDYRPDIFNKIEQGYKMIVQERQKVKNK